jgi:hypothetical protein
VKPTVQLEWYTEDQSRIDLLRFQYSFITALTLDSERFGIITHSLISISVW